MKKIFLILITVSSILFSQTSSVFNLQGVLRLPSGKAVPDGQYRFEFKIYDVLEGGTPINNWIESHTGVEVKNGIYNILIGSKTPFSGLAFDKLYYVSISVNGGSPMSPRVQLSASPYALSIQGTNNKIPNSGAITFDKDVWHKSIDNKNRIKFDNNSNTVLNGQVSIEGGNLSITNNAQTLSLIGSDHTYIGFFPDGATTRKAFTGFASASSNDFVINNEISSGNILLYTTSGKVGVNKTNPEYTLDVGGYIKADNIMYKILDTTSSNFNTKYINVNINNSSRFKIFKIYFNVYQGGSKDSWAFLKFNGSSSGYKSETKVKFHGGDEDGESAIWSIVMGRNGWNQNGRVVGEATIFNQSNQDKQVYGEYTFMNSSNPTRGRFFGNFTSGNTNIYKIEFGNINNNFGDGTILIYGLP